MVKLRTLVILMVALVACAEPSIQNSGGAADLSDVGHWQADMSTFKEDSDGRLGISVFTLSQGSIEIEITFENLDYITDTVQLRYLDFTDPNGPPTSYIHTFLGDQWSEYYDLWETSELTSWIKLERIRRNRITGTFQTAYVLNPDLGVTYHGLPDTIMVTNGEFEARRLK